MVSRVQAFQQRELQYRNVGIGKRHFQRNEGSVIVAPLRVLYGCKTGLFQQDAHLSGQFRRAGRRVFQFVGVRGKALVIVDHARLGGAAHAGLLLLPMRRDQHNRLRFFRQASGDAAQKIRHSVPGVSRVPLHEKARPCAMRHKKGGHAAGRACRVGGVERGNHIGSLSVELRGFSS